MVWRLGNQRLPKWRLWTRGLGCSGGYRTNTADSQEQTKYPHRIKATFEFGKSGSIKKGAGIDAF